MVKARLLNEFNSYRLNAIMGQALLERRVLQCDNEMLLYY